MFCKKSVSIVLPTSHDTIINIRVKINCVRHQTAGEINIKSICNSYKISLNISRTKKLMRFEKPLQQALIWVQSQTCSSIRWFTALKRVKGCQKARWLKMSKKEGDFSYFIFDMSDKKLNIFFTAGPNLMGLPPLSLFFQGL